MSSENFDFQAFISEQTDPEARSLILSFGDYAYRGDIKYLRTLHTFAPVRLLVGATLQLWSGWGRGAVLKGATRCSEKEGARIYQLGRDCARDLHEPPVQIHLTPHLVSAPVQAFGDRDETFIAVHTEAVTHLRDDALRFLIGRQLGHIQNRHVLYETAAFYADELANVVVRWAVKPAVLALNQWRRRAALSADRAGLICCRSLEVATRQILQRGLASERQEQDVDIDALLEEFEQTELQPGKRFARVLKKNPNLSLRVRALRLFAGSRLYLDHIGSSAQDGRTLSRIDDDVDQLL